jgi:transcriptional regulator with XRE-family HTH domain
MKKTKTARIQDLLAQGKSQADIARSLKVSRQLVSKVARNTRENSEFVSKVFEKVGFSKPSKILEAVEETKADFDLIKPKVWTLRPEDSQDNVNHPPHYRAGGIETIDFIEAKDLNYRLGNVVKYVSRAGKKASDPIEDLKKAAWYLEREISARERA